MKCYLTKLQLFLVASFFIISCNPTINSNSGSDNTKVESSNSNIDTVTVAEANTKPEAIVLKNTSLEKDVPERLARSKQLDRADLKLLSIAAIDSAPADQFKYHLFDTLFWGTQAKILLIGREYIEENIIWATSYDANNNLIDKLQVYYDNSEGFLTILSQVHNNLFLISDHSDETEDEAKQKPSVYSLNEVNKFVKQQR